MEGMTTKASNRTCLLQKMHFMSSLSFPVPLSLSIVQLQHYIATHQQTSSRNSTIYHEALSHTAQPDLSTTSKIHPSRTSSSSTYPSNHSALYQRRFNHATPLLQNPHGDCETRVPCITRLPSAKAIAPICMVVRCVCVKGAVVEAGWPIKI
jgi:hypothetical protein